MGEQGGGGGSDDDPHKIKRIAAAAYDYDNDSRWASYWENVLVPPHMASHPDLTGHFKRKFYKRYIDPDFVVEAMSTGSSGATSSQSSGPTRRSSTPPSSDNTSRPRDTGSSTQSARNATSRPFDRRSIHFSVNSWVILVGLVAILPIVPPHIFHKAYRLALLGTICSSFYSLYTVHGKPRAWNLTALQPWFQGILGTKEFIRLVYCLTFITSHLHIKFALIPVLIWALEHVGKYLRRNFSRSNLYRKYLEDPCLWIDSNASTLGIMTSHAEIALGLLLILSLLSWHRNIIHTFMYWQLLKLMYHSPATAGYHQSAWTKIGRTVNPYLNRYAPFLSRPVSAVQRWWFR
ncbi:dihydroflavonol 4-reductase/flavanone protein [Rhynchospora pubera]|uniref:Dihydroflavonol 4-reductase/flavanone protein n=1 Tax=Rhynchospora pubera TaxID=906938 RepID=A0AAV8H6D7_9POAL|nr:dihydroflavonol 4-reductase/flavanone protein [Rhynchospora pubera]